VAALLGAIMQRRSESSDWIVVPRPSLLPQQLPCACLAPTHANPPPLTSSPLPPTYLHPAASLKARDWALLLWCLARQGATPPPQWLAAAAASTWHKLRFCSAQDFANTLWAMARLGAAPGAPWRSRWVRYWRGRFCGCWVAFGFDRWILTLLLIPEICVRSLLQTPKVSTPQSDQPSNLNRPSTSPRFFTESYSQLFHFQPRHLAQTLTAAAQLKWRPPTEWMDRAYLESFGGLDYNRWSAAELAAVMNALGRLRLRPPVQWMAAAVAAMAAQAEDAGHQVGLGVVVGLDVWAVEHLLLCRRFICPQHLSTPPNPPTEPNPRSSTTASGRCACCATARRTRPSRPWQIASARSRHGASWM
jgi:hypothetical protein